MQEVICRIIFYHGTHIVVQIIFPLVFQGLPHHICRAEQTHRLWTGQYDVISLFQSFQIASYNSRLENTEEIIIAKSFIQSKLFLAYAILVIIHPTLIAAITDDMGRCHRQAFYYRASQRGEMAFTGSQIHCHPEQVLVLRKALVVTQVVVHLRHDDEERSECQAQS